MKHNLLKRTTLLFLVFSFLISALGYSTPVYAQTAPTLLAPENGSTKTAENTPPLAIPEFKWKAVAGATLYRLQISNSPGFSSTVVDVATPLTSFTPITTSGFSDGDWYWRVKVEAPAPSVYSNNWSFIKKWATLTNRPTLLAPADGVSVAYFDNPTFSWSPITGAARYIIQIYTAPGGWASPVPNGQQVTLNTSYQPNFKWPNGKYYWRVVPLDPTDHLGTPSEERDFTLAYNFVPTLISPTNNSNPVFTPTFRWTAVRGAQTYHLQFGTKNDFTSDTTTIDTPNTTFTPLVTIPNDVDYFWRVRAKSGESVSDWTVGSSGALGRIFRKQWYLQAQTLTPRNGYLNVRIPFFSWTPIPGAASYRLDFDTDPNFSQPITQTINTSNTFLTPGDYNGTYAKYYWRVTPYDGSNWPGKASGDPNPPFAFESEADTVAPEQVYPFYYYEPDNYAGHPEITTNPHEDRTAPLPIFIWHRLTAPYNDATPGADFAPAYRIEVDEDQLFGSPDWVAETENTIAAPTAANPFVPNPSKRYYWHVIALNGIGAATKGEWSQTWLARFDLSKGLTPTAAASAPEVLRPENGFEAIETTPMLEWFPVSGATSYNVEISQDSNFGSLVNSATVPYPMYTPTQSFAQRSKNAVNFGIYYWRVRKATPSVGPWSTAQRFQIAGQSIWNKTRVIGSAGNRIQIGSDAAGDVSANYDLTDLNVTQSKDDWYFGFHVPSTPSQNVTYAIYLDTDHVGGSGGSFDAYNPAYNITTIAGYRPEYIIYVPRQSGGTINQNATHIFHWNKDTQLWELVTSNVGNGGGLPGSGGQVKQYNDSYVETVTGGNYIEVEAPNNVIGYEERTGSYSVTLLSLPAGGSGAPQDSVPSDPNVPGSGAISRFANVSEHVNVLTPPDSRGIDPTVFPSFPPFFWDPPVLAPWGGANLNIYLDTDLTTPISNYQTQTTGAYYGHIEHAWPSDILGDNTYFWRVQPLYYDPQGHVLGSLSYRPRFERVGFIAKNLQTSVTFATPTFSWDMVEGAQSYNLVVDNDENFATPIISINTTQNSFTPNNTLPNGDYHWSVQVVRSGAGGAAVINGWAPTKHFTLAMPSPTGLSPASETIVSKAPTLCWAPLIQSSGGQPVLAAYKYAVQVSNDPGYSPTSLILDGMVTEQNCWTPQVGYPDGKYYWRVAMRDKNDYQGAWTANQTFIKQYAAPTLVKPTSGSVADTMPTFVWTAVNGAKAYRLQVSETHTFSSIYDTVLTENTSFTPIFKYSIGKTYHWRVAIVDYNGWLGPYSTATIILNPPTVAFVSVAKHDGWTLESGEASNIGGATNSTLNTLNVGDDAAKKQYRSILSFSTGGNLPDAAIITGVSLRLKKHSIIGGVDPINIFNGFMADVKNGFFGGSSSLEKVDFQNKAGKNCGPFKPALTNNTYTISLICAKDAINKGSANNGLTQIRLRFKLDDNNNTIANYLKLFSSDATTPSDRPQLIITYYEP